MSVHSYNSVNDFLNDTLDFRVKHVYQTQIMSSVAQSVADKSRTYDKYFWWCVRNEDQTVAGIAMRTAPHGMLLSPMSKPTAHELAAEVANLDDELPGIGGPTEIVRDFLNGYVATASSGSKREVEVAGRELLYILEDLVLPQIPGEMRAAKEAELSETMEWLVDFANEAGVLMHDVREAAEDGLRRNSTRWWVVNNEKVSLAGHAPIVEVPGGKVARIGPVFTPPAHRRQGYAGALTAALSRELLNSGAKVMLYTDANNPTSNGVYQRIGFVKIGENERLRFVNES